jgi:ABC-2 type transport system ATP-binding protein
MIEADATAAARLRGLTKRFPGFQLGPLDVVLEPGTVLALIGPNGAGKTTTLNCLAGLTVPDEGGAEVFGAPVHPAYTEYRRDVGYVGEEGGFFRRWTAGRNLDYLARLLPGWSQDRARRLADRFGLPLGKAVQDLSRGNRTKLALVAALAHGPRLLLLDEPTAGLDPVVRSEVLDVLWEVTEDGAHAVLYSGQEATAARRQRRRRAAAAGWAGFVAAVLLFSALSVAAFLVQGPLTWASLHLGNLIIAATVGMGSAAL